MRRASGRWWTAAVIVPVIMLVLLVTIPVLFAGGLPDPLAVHWGTNGEPNGTLSLGGLVALVAGLFALIWLGSLAAHRGGSLLPPVVAVLFFVGGLLLGAVVVTIVANDGAESWADASGVDLVNVLAIVGGAVVAGGIGWLAAGGRRSASPAIATDAAPTVGLGAGETAAWTSAGVSVWVPALGLAGLAAALVMQGTTGILLGVVAVVLLGASAIQVTVSAAGVGIGLGWWGWPRRVVPLDQIARAEVIQVEPLAYGGWGYRVLTGRVLTGARAVVIRRGPGIRLVRDDRPDLIVTVDDADRGAGLVNDLLRQRGLLRTA